MQMYKYPKNLHVCMPSVATNRMHKNLWISTWGQRAHHLHTQRHQHKEQCANSGNLQFLSQLLCTIGCTSMSELMVALQEMFLDLFSFPHVCRKLSNEVFIFELIQILFEDMSFSEKYINTVSIVFISSNDTKVANKNSTSSDQQPSLIG